MPDTLRFPLFSRFVLAAVQALMKYSACHSKSILNWPSRMGNGPLLG
jgi:hypothetical protein